MIPPSPKKKVTIIAGASTTDGLKSDFPPASSIIRKMLENRPLARRRLFFDEPLDNSLPPAPSDSLPIVDPLDVEKAKALLIYGFDTITDIPSSLIRSDYVWTAERAQDIPEFYSRSYTTGRGPSKYGDRLRPPTMPRYSIAPPFEPATTSSSFAANTATEDRATTSTSAEITATTESAVRMISAQMADYKTPGKGKRKAKTSGNRTSSTISEQTLVTDYYSHTKRPAAGANPMKSRKRTRMEIDDSSPDAGETSSGSGRPM